MDGASWRQLEYRGPRSSLEEGMQNRLRAERANRLTEVIALTLIAAAAVGILVSATLALVGTDLS